MVIFLGKCCSYKNWFEDDLMPSLSIKVKVYLKVVPPQYVASRYVRSELRNLKKPESRS